jgi:FkbM family methyltransferase
MGQPLKSLFQNDLAKCPVENYADGKTIEVETITFKDFIHKNTLVYIDFLKVDCEGSEVFIFIEENTAFFRTKVHKIALEFHNQYFGHFLSERGEQPRPQTG